jgi:hypothetical protein
MQKNSVRKLQLKPYSSSAALIWWNAENEIQISLVRPTPLRRFFPNPIDPPLEKGCKVLARWNRHATIRLPTEKGCGFFRVQELTNKYIVVVEESSMPADLARKLEIHSGSTIAIAERIPEGNERRLKRLRLDQTPYTPVEFKLGKRFLADLFSTTKDRVTVVKPPRNPI